MSLNDYSLYEDHELIVLLQKGDADAFTCIYDRYWEKLFAIAYHYCREKEMAREIVQDIFMSLWDRKSSILIQSLSAYLATAAKFLVFRELRKESRRKNSRETNLSVRTAISEEEAIDARFLHDYIRGQVEQLPISAGSYTATAGSSISLSARLQVSSEYLRKQRRIILPGL